MRGVNIKLNLENGKLMQELDAVNSENERLKIIIGGVAAFTQAVACNVILSESKEE